MAKMGGIAIDKDGEDRRVAVATIPLTGRMIEESGKKGVLGSAAQGGSRRLKAGAPNVDANTMVGGGGWVHSIRRAGVRGGIRSR